MMMKKETNTMKKECSKELEKSNILEVENEIFANIMREHAIEVNEMQKEGKKRKKKRKRGKRKTEDCKRKHTTRQCMRETLKSIN